MPDPSVSVVVATLNRSRYLRICLEALTKQIAPPESFEVIVVDNGSSDDTAEVARGFCGAGRNFRYVLQPKPGVSAARNLGVKESRADVVAFTDDDAVPDPHWVARIAARFEELGDEVAVLGGEVRPIWEAPRPAWLSNELLRPISAGLMWSPTARIMRDEEWLIEANIAYRKSAFVAFGGFAEHLGRVGETLVSCEQSVNLLLTQAGLFAFFDPDILVGHHIHASRLNRTWFRRRLFWQGVSMNRVHQYVSQMSKELKIEPGDQPPRHAAEIVLPTSMAEWVELFDDQNDMKLEQQVSAIEQLGYFLDSQSLLGGR